MPTVMKNSSFPRLTRRELLGSAAAATGLSLAGAGCAPLRGGRPNILWIIAEDFCPDLGCYGNKDLQTPRLDDLAGQGMRFTTAIMTGPVCSAARSALATGMYQTSIGAQNHRSHRGDGYTLPPPVQPFTHFLQAAGYYTANLKNSHGLHGTGKTDLNYKTEHLFDGEDWSERAKDQPFYAQINFSETHRAFRSFPERRVNPDTLTSLPPYYPDVPPVRLDWATYLEDAEHLDVNAGRVLDRLDKEGLADDTIVFFFADHGRAMPRGKQFLYDAGIHIPLIVRIPEKLRLEGYTAGGLNEDLISSIDITATTLRAAGIEPPSYMEGRPFFGPRVEKRSYAISARDRCDETVDRIRSVREKRYHYIKNFFPNRPYTQQNCYKDTQYPILAVMRQLKAAGKLTGPAALFMADTRPPEELYDLQQDPYEIKNLAEQTDQAERLAGMREILDGWIEKTGDKGAIPEKGVQPQDKYRHKIDGWCTRTNAIPTKANGRLKVECFGKGAHLIRAYVAKGVELALQFKARSTDTPITAVQWGSIQDLRNPKFRSKVDFKTDGKWRVYSVPFSVEGYLAQLTFHFGEQKGAIDFDWIRLIRREKGKSVTIKEWDFA